MKTKRAFCCLIRCLFAGLPIVFQIATFLVYFESDRALSHASESATADLRMIFVYDADTIPERRPLVLPGDPSCMPENLQPLSESLLVNRSNRGIKNVVLYLDTRINPVQDVRSTLSEDVKVPPARLEIQNCVYVPHVFSVRVGQKIELYNHDRFGHNPSLIFFQNDPESRLQPPENVFSVEPKVSERAPTPIQCNLHPWMKAYAVVVDHPYVGISDEDGVLTLRNLPARKKWTFRIWHENFASPIQQLVIQDRTVKLQQNRIEIELEPGNTNWGEIRLAPSSFLK